MTISLEVQQQIAAGPAEVFGFLADLSCHLKWNSHLISIAPETTMTEGMTYRTSSQLLGKRIKSLNTVTKLVEPSQIVIENEAGPLHYHVTYSIKADSKGCILTCACAISSISSIFHIAAPLAEVVARDQITSDLQSLKELVEAD